MIYWHIGNSKKARAMVAITVVKKTALFIQQMTASK
jgi:hypothetical protein